MRRAHLRHQQGSVFLEGAANHHHNRGEEDQSHHSGSGQGGRVMTSVADANTEAMLPNSSRR